MSARVAGSCAGALLALAGGVAHAADAAVLIRNATVHTQTAQGVLKDADLLIVDGRIAALGHGLAAPAGAQVIDAAGRPVTPGLYAGLSALGLEETGLVDGVADETLKLGAMHPEFDVTLAYNPDSIAIGVTRLDGFTHTLLAPASGEGGSIVAGQGGVVALDGGTTPLSRVLFVDLGADVSQLTGHSRAAQYLLLDQALAEARGAKSLQSEDARLLTAAGRHALAGFLKGAGPIVISVDRAADIRRVLAWAAREKLAIVIAGGAEAWRLAPELAAAKVPVVLNPLANLPDSFDAVGSTLENAARLHRAGVTVAFSIGQGEVHNARKLRQAAGIAVANGLPWDVALAALTRVPAEIFGAGASTGRLATGRPADLVLWSGDPLEVTTHAERVYIGGRLQPARSRQTELRDRYLEKLRRGAAR